MARGWLLACVVACGCVPHGAKIARLEAKVEALQTQHRRNLSLQHAQSEKLGALRARITTLEKDAQEVAAYAPPARSHVVVVPEDPSTHTVDKLQTLYSRAGRLLDDLIGSGHRAAVSSLVTEYLAINYHGGMLSQSLREKYIGQLSRILYYAERIGHGK